MEELISMLVTWVLVGFGLGLGWNLGSTLVARWFWTPELQGVQYSVAAGDVDDEEGDPEDE